jgi:hypothetical protein
VHIQVRDSDFRHNGTCAQACAHGIYVGHIAALRVERSRFFDTQQGHAIKSRAQNTEVTDCVIEDGPTGTSSYAIDIPNGGRLIASGNRIEKGRRSDNRGVVMSIGEEGVTQATPEILVTNNDVSLEGGGVTVLLRNATGTQAVFRGNRLTGGVQLK